MQRVDGPADIVVLLRATARNFPDASLLRDAADEIERLRDALNRAERLLSICEVAAPED
jgi:hypothetical protein